MAEMTPKEVLVAAKEVLQDHGWTKHVFVDDRGCVCAVGAVLQVVYGDPVPEWGTEFRLTTPGLRELAQAVLREGSAVNDVRTISAFNNQEDVTEGDIYDIYDRAIELAEVQA